MGKLDYLIKHNRFFQKLYKKTFSFLFSFFSLFFKVDSKRVIFQSMIGRNCEDSPRVIFELMKNDPMYKDYCFVWAVIDTKKYEYMDCKIVKLDSIAYFIQMFKSKFWISNVGIERGLNFKKKSQIYINTWHGIPIKKIGNSQGARADYNFFDIDMMCASNDYERDIFIRDFSMNTKQIYNIGMPRNDELYDIKNFDIISIKNSLGIPNNKKVILYAPTWRDSQNKGDSYDIAPPIDIESWRNLLSDDYVVLFRLHHLTTKALGLVFDDFILDVSNYPKVNELMAISDVLISDYSAIIFDFSILEKPIISFAYDIEKYKSSRGLYQDLSLLLPNSVFEKENELLACLLSGEFEKITDDVKRIKKAYLPEKAISCDSIMRYIHERS